MQVMASWEGWPRWPTGLGLRVWPCSMPHSRHNALPTHTPPHTHTHALPPPQPPPRPALPACPQVLSVSKALSIQSHPDKQLAERLHAEHPKVGAGRGWAAWGLGALGLEPWWGPGWSLGPGSGPRSGSGWWRLNPGSVSGSGWRLNPGSGLGTGLGPVWITADL